MNERFALKKLKGSQESLYFGIAIGIAIGAGIGVAINNIAVGVGCGVALGVSVGTLLVKKTKKDSTYNNNAA